MAFDPPQPPIILIGMHRSGTSLLTRQMARMGVALGNHTDPNDEAVLFSALNGWLMRCSGGAWDHPHPIDDLLDHADVRPMATTYVERVLRSPRAARYVGWAQWLRSRRPWPAEGSWGWKDPRNTFTLPIWLDLFPDARVIHITRHGVDVAASLRTRHRADVANAQANQPSFGLLEWTVDKRPIASGLRCRTLEGGFSLWEAYVERARHHVQALGDRAVELTFEELAHDPNKQLERIIDHCRIETTNDALAEAAAMIEGGRARAYRSDDELARFSASVSDRLRSHGYEP